ncbi:uncharacterized protein LOC133368445 [Rhineura floridana]|uniref:uncharacterized protein LOC133368445 n=1 Tax=Rhineura floridana TaxID=261503 RepID=UPI002AC87B7D|nr:uncharacterized protein LOC133368445 [Rhineura floridana]
MGHRHSKWSLHPKQRETPFLYGKYTAITVPGSPRGQISQDASMWTSESNSSIGSIGDTKQLTGAETVSQTAQEGVLPVQQDAETQPVFKSPQENLEDLKEPQPAVRLEKGNGAFQPTMDGVHKAELAVQEPPHLETFLAAEVTPSKEMALEDQETLLLTPSERSIVQMSENPSENVKEMEVTMETIWTVDHEDSEVQTSTELEEHPHCCEEEDSSRAFSSRVRATKWT